ncbi:MAG: hypothetical protein D3924_11625 [Candidatus Electrothrix sp. AR4]|nr:hypothetical protein [Candidatus Electrothrix sp. AR4]
MKNMLLRRRRILSIQKRTNLMHLKTFRFLHPNHSALLKAWNDPVASMLTLPHTYNNSTHIFEVVKTASASLSSSSSSSFSSSSLPEKEHTNMIYFKSSPTR